MHIVYHMAVIEVHTHEHTHRHTHTHAHTHRDTHMHAHTRTHTPTLTHFIILRFLNPWSLITCFSTCIVCKAVGLQGQLDPVLIQVWIHHTNILPLLVSVTAD